MKTFVLLSLLAFSLSALALPAESTISYSGKVVSAFISRNLDDVNENVERAMITIHGSERNANTYYNSIEMLTNKFKLAEKSVIIAPHFKNRQDILIANEMNWTDEGWLSGDGALNNEVASSFAFMDHVIGVLHKSYPNLKEVIMTGHSAGGQFIQRYALGSTLERTYPKTHFRYVAANPGSYVYLTKARPVQGPTPCRYNNYKYGLDNLNFYMGRMTKFTIINEYLTKDVVYLAGESDTISEDIDQTCAAQYQGLNRITRARNFKAQLDRDYPQNVHHLETVPGIGHTQYGMYTSEVGQRVLFQ